MTIRILFYSDIKGLISNYPTFIQLPESMQWGVYVDFFDSVGIIIDTQPVIDYDKEKYIKVDYFILNITVLHKQMKDTDCGNFPTRPKTREESIKAANQIYNENKY